MSAWKLTFAKEKRETTQAFNTTQEINEIRKR